MKSIYEFYKDGVFTGDSVISASEPADREGLEKRQVDRPSRPPDIEGFDWAQGEDGMSWVPVRHAATEEQTIAAEVLAALQTCDSKLVRPLVEIVAALMAGQTPPADDVAMFASLRAEKTLQRAKLAKAKT